MEIQGKVAVVTGAGSGIGRACALALGREGASVVVGDVDPVGGQETVALLGEAGAEAAFVPVDVADPDEIAALFDAAADRFGGIDIVHNNAGIVCGEPLWPDTDPKRLLQQVLINLGGVIVGTRLAIPHLDRRGGGVVVNTGSLASLLAMPEEPGYSATKAGVLMFTRGCAGMLETHNIRVNAVLPGLVNTPLLLKSGDGTRMASWAQNAAHLLPTLSPDLVASAVVEFVHDDTAAGQHKIVGELPAFLAEVIGT